jgi:uncharacterized protein YjbI with pentapeptide repeats
MAGEFRTPGRGLSRRLSLSRDYWKTQGTQGAPLVLPGADLKRLDLREQVLVEAQLQGADLRGSALNSALLMRAALDGAQMNGASLYSSDMSKTTLVEARLAGVQAPRSKWHSATLTGADFTGALLNDCDFTGADLLNAKLARASVVHSNFSNALMLGASFREADITDAVLIEAVIDPQTLAGAIGSFHGTPAVVLVKSRRRRTSLHSEFEAEVLATIQRSGVSAMWGFDRGPDFVVELPGEWFAAVEVTGTAERGTLATLADRADLIVVPDNRDVRVAMNNTPITRLRDLEMAIVQLEPSRLKPLGAAALLAREAARLRPYVALAARDKADPSFISRLSVYLDTKEDFLLGEGDRRFAKQLPAHLGGEMPARGSAWAQEHAEELANLLSQSARIQQGAQMETEAVTHLARQAWRFEHELAAAMQPKR